MEHHEISDPAMRLRLEWARALCFALGECDPSDGAAICCAFLDSVSAGAPDIAIHVDVRDTARWWAEWAHPAELEATAAAALSKLGNTALGLSARKRLFTVLWRSFPDGDRVAFLARVDADGRFHGRATA